MWVLGNWSHRDARGLLASQPSLTDELQAQRGMWISEDDTRCQPTATHKHKGMHTNPLILERDKEKEASVAVKTWLSRSPNHSQTQIPSSVGLILWAQGRR